MRSFSSFCQLHQCRSKLTAGVTQLGVALAHMIINQAKTHWTQYICMGNKTVPVGGVLEIRPQRYKSILTVWERGESDSAPPKQKRWQMSILKTFARWIFLGFSHACKWKLRSFLSGIFLLFPTTALTQIKNIIKIFQLTKQIWENTSKEST